MKENRNGYIVTIIISTLGIVLSIISKSFGFCDFFCDLGFALFGSGFISCVICLINYLVFKNRMLENISNCYEKLGSAFIVCKNTFKVEKQNSLNNFFINLIAIEQILHNEYLHSQDSLNICCKEKISKEIVYQLFVCFCEYKNYVEHLIFNCEFEKIEISCLITSKFDEFLKLIEQLENFVFSKKKNKLKYDNRKYLKKELNNE